MRIDTPRCNVCAIGMELFDAVLDRKVRADGNNCAILLAMSHIFFKFLSVSNKGGIEIIP
jgi:hypothetical protein